MIWLLMTAGRGPDECQIAVAGFARILLAEAEVLAVGAEIVDLVAARHGLASAVLGLDGENAQSLASEWVGTVQWNCPSPLRPGWKRKRWFVGVSLVEPPETSPGLDPGDVHYQACRASGPGGQHVNKVSSAVRAVHKPTGLTVFARGERSQHRNKAVALARLAELMVAARTEREQSGRQEMWTSHDSLERGRAVRVYEGPSFRRVMP